MPVLPTRSSTLVETHGPEAPLVQVQRLHAGATMPTYQTPGAAGLDLHACVDADVVMEPGTIAVVATGWAIAIASGFEGQVRPRSGLATKHGLTVPNAPGTIDCDYRGELKVALINLGREAFIVTQGMRIAQLVIAPVARAQMVEVKQLAATARGAGGFGSTGV
jgi:dUTP pyrophosphatase